MGWLRDIQDQAVVTCEAFRAANPTMADRVYHVKPESIAETAAIYIGDMVEAVRHDSGTWQRVVDVEIVCTRHLADNAETKVDILDISDALMDYLSANDRAHAFGAHTEQHPTGSRPAEVAEGTVFIPARVITCRATIQQGRT